MSKRANKFYDYKYAISYINPGDPRSKAYYCRSYSNLSDAQKYAESGFLNNPETNGTYVISIIKQDVFNDIFFIRYDRATNTLRFEAIM